MKDILLLKQFLLKIKKVSKFRQPFTITKLKLSLTNSVQLSLTNTVVAYDLMTDIETTSD